MNHAKEMSGYGLWLLVIVNAGIILFFAFSFARPTTKRDWRSFGAFSAFIVALFVEMYGFPLTIYLLMPSIMRRFPGIDPLGHDFGHLWFTLLGLKSDPHFNPIHLLSDGLIIAGFLLLSAAWPVLYRASKEGTLATSGPYARVRHPQYIGFIVIITGFLIQWPTLVTLIMFPVLLTVYVRLAHREEREAAARFPEWSAYAAATPRWFPRFGPGRGRGDLLAHTDGKE